MRILLAYSVHHFDPACPERVSLASAAVLARALYGILSRFGEVEYVDGLNPPRRLKAEHYDLLVSILGGISTLCRRVSVDKVILFAVNMHPAERNEILERFNARYHVCGSHSLDKAIVSLSTLDDMARADAVFLVGNGTVRDSYLRHGVPPEKVRAFNYASGLPLREKGALGVSAQVPRFVYVATEMCLRKGFDIMAELFCQAAAAGRAFHLSIIGGMGNRRYAAKLEALQRTLGSQLSVEGWVPSDSAQYPELLRQHDYVIFPSLEEGQAGSVLDALACGLVPLVTRETGVDWSPLGFLEAELGSAENAAVLHRALEVDAAERAQLKAQTLDYYAAEHLPWVEHLQQALEHFLATGEVYERGQCPASRVTWVPPTVSVWRRRVLAPLACVLSFICPSRQKRKRLWNYYRATR